ncbi:MAG: hypothetical protein WBF17_16250, partial [Phycisphaerae bacterium]
MKRRRLCCLTAAILLSTVVGSATAQTHRTWDAGGDGTDWFDPDNWDPTGAQAPSDALSVLFGSPETTAEVRTSSGGSITIDAWDSPASASFRRLRIGYAGIGTLNIANGGAVSSTYPYIAYSSDSNGTVTVDGSGSTWTNSSPLYVGYEGTGELTIRNGGTASSNTFAYIA